MINFTNDLLVEILPAGAHSVFELVQAGNQSVIHALLQNPYSVIKTGFKSGLLEATPTVESIFTKHFVSYANNAVRVNNVRHYNIHIVSVRLG